VTKVCDLIALLRINGEVTNLPLRRQGLYREIALSWHAGKTGFETNLSESLTIRSFGYRLEPRYIFRAGRLDQ